MKQYLYTFSCHPDEQELLQMEMRAFFQKQSDDGVILSDQQIDPSRSPFSIGRLEILYKAKEFEQIHEFATKYSAEDKTYKVVSLNKEKYKLPYKTRRNLELQLGLAIEGEPDLHNPEITYGVFQYNDNWYFGIYTTANNDWYKHIDKPHQYSTALNTRVARAAMNILAPYPAGKRYIDPCCGIGTVLIEGLSMGIDITGRDINPLVCMPARENLAYFNLNGTITKGDIGDITEHFDGAIIDLPYNICHFISKEELQHIFQSARKIADTVLFITTENVDELIRNNNFTVTDRCIVRKSHHFERQILLCK